MVRRLARRASGASGAFRRGFGGAILFAALVVAPAAILAAELGQPAPGSTIKRLSPPKSGAIGGLEGFPGHSTAPGKAGAIPRQPARVRRSVTADTALRLARYFRTDPRFWLNLQAAHDLSVAKAETDYSKLPEYA